MRVGCRTALFEPPNPAALPETGMQGGREAHLQLHMGGPGTFPPAAPRCLCAGRNTAGDVTGCSGENSGSGIR